MTEYMPCPKCGNSDVNAIQKVGYTLWGGALGPKLFNHVKCTKCGTTYNGKTGQSNTTNIIIYTVVVFIIVFLIYMVIANM
jgi:uncharacterized Zn finger protein